MKKAQVCRTEGKVENIYQRIEALIRDELEQHLHLDTHNSIVRERNARIDALRAEVLRLKCLCAAAADEIEQFWLAHCDSDGFGPVNLMRGLRGRTRPHYGESAGAQAKKAGDGR